MIPAAQLFANAEVILLDFDGPICSVFANHPPELASRAAVRAVRNRAIAVPNDWAKRRDPHALLQDLACLHAMTVETLLVADEAICRYEVEAVGDAVPTAQLSELLDSVGDRRWAIVSNNCVKAIALYLKRATYGSTPHAVVGRELGAPRSLKPAPVLVQKALHQLGARPEKAVLIGDSSSDVLAGRAAGVPVIGYANKPGKTAKLTQAGASVVVSNLRALLSSPR